MLSLPQNRVSKATLRVEKSQFDVVDWSPFPKNLEHIFLCSFVYWNDTPHTLDFILQKCCFSGHTGMLEAVDMIIQLSFSGHTSMLERVDVIIQLSVYGILSYKCVKTGSKCILTHIFMRSTGIHSSHIHLSIPVKDEVKSNI